MKKNLIKTILTLVLAFVCVFSIVACNQDTGSGAESSQNPDPKIAGGETSSSLSTNNILLYYIKLDGIEGESKRATHDRWIEVIDFSCGAEVDEENETTNVTVTFTHKVDKATPKIQKKCLEGTKVSNAEFNAIEYITGAKVLKAVFSDVKILDSTVQTVTDSFGSSSLIEKVSMLVASETVTTPTEQNVSLSGNGQSYYLKLDGIEGASKNTYHNRWIDVIDFSYGGRQTEYTEMPFFGIDGEFKPIVFTHSLDVATPTIQSDCIKGNKLSGEFNATKSTAGKESVTYKIAFNNLKIIKAVIKTVKGENGNSYLIEEVTMTAEKETWTYNQIGLDNTDSGSTEESFDQTKRA